MEPGFAEGKYGIVLFDTQNKFNKRLISAFLPYNNKKSFKMQYNNYTNKITCLVCFLVQWTSFSNYGSQAKNYDEVASIWLAADDYR